jgi:hypothetical protein
VPQNFIACDREQELLPPSLREWLPEDHFAWFAAQLLSSDGTVETAWGDSVAGQPMLTPAQRRAALATGPTVISRQLGAAGFRVVAVPVTRHGRASLVVAAAALARTG